MAIALTLPGVKADRRRTPQSGVVPPTNFDGSRAGLFPEAPDGKQWVDPNWPWDKRQQMPPRPYIQGQAAPDQTPVSTGLDPAIVARLASKADQVGFNNADVGKLLKMLPEVIALLTAPMELVKTGDPQRPYRRELVRPQATDMTGQTAVD